MGGLSVLPAKDSVFHSIDVCHIGNDSHLKSISAAKTFMTWLIVGHYQFTAAFGMAAKLLHLTSPTTWERFQVSGWKVPQRLGLIVSGPHRWGNVNTFVHPTVSLQ
jgi:hypothetical protein